MNEKSSIKARHSGIELLKIFAIFFVILSHSTPFWGLFNQPHSHKIGYVNLNTATENIQVLLAGLGHNLGQIGNLIFFIASAWFLVDSKKFKVNKVAHMIFDVVFLSASIMLITLAIGNINLPLKEMIKACFPFTFSLYWYMTCYLIIYMIYPIMNKAIDNITQRQHFAFCVVFTVLYMGINFLRTAFSYTNLIGFIGIYFIVGYFKRFMFNTVATKKFNIAVLIFGLFCWLTSTLLTNYLGLRIGFFYNKISRYNQLINPFFFLIAFSIFNLFRRLTFNSKIINYLSSITLIIYIIHAHPILMGYTKFDFFKNIYTNYTYKYFVLWSILLAVVLFISTTIVAIIYNKLIQPFIHKLSEFVLRIALKVYEKIEQLIFKLN